MTRDNEKRVLRERRQARAVKHTAQHAQLSPMLHAFGLETSADMERAMYRQRSPRERRT